MKSKFKRPTTRGKNTADVKGTVQVRILLLTNGRTAKGNVSKSFSVASSRVSEVAVFVERALFNGK